MPANDPTAESLELKSNPDSLPLNRPSFRRHKPFRPTRNVQVRAQGSAVNFEPVGKIMPNAGKTTQVRRRQSLPIQLHVHRKLITFGFVVSVQIRLCIANFDDRRI
jgi:hypothetical protein